MKTEYYGHGKLLVTGEYAVLDGADSLAIPTRQGQRMEVRRYKGSDLIWESFDVHGNSWFSTTISLYDFSAIKTTDSKKSSLLKKILKNAVRLNPEFLDKWNGFKVKTYLEFPIDWGLGSSSTLIHLIASWADVHPLELYFKTYDGSGYDVACAGCDTPIVYYNDEDEIGYTPVEFNPDFAEYLYFVHLGVKKDTQVAVKEYLMNARSRKSLAKSITQITDATVETKSLQEFIRLMEEHENIISKAIGEPKVKDKHFSDFWGGVKSLGAWGGDFVMVMSDNDEAMITSYFKNKGYTTIIPFSEMILGDKKTLKKVK